MPFRSVVQDIVDTLSPSSRILDAEFRPRSARRFQSLPGQLYTMHAPTVSASRLGHMEPASRGVYQNPDATSSVISSSTYYSARSSISLSSIKSRRSIADFHAASGISRVVAKMPSRSRLLRNPEASGTTLAPVVEDRSATVDQIFPHMDDQTSHIIFPTENKLSNCPQTSSEPSTTSVENTQGFNQPYQCAFDQMPCSTEPSSSISKAIESEPGPDKTPKAEDAASLSEAEDGLMTNVTHANIVVEAGKMTLADMFRCLLKHGCEDFTPMIDPEKCSPSKVDVGGFGDIWKEELRDGTCVAIKTLRFALSAGGRSSKGLKRMMREIYVWSKLDHKNIHKLMGVTIYKGELGMVSEWMTNGNLRDYLMKNSSVDRYKLCIQIARAVTYIHDQDFVHGDIKASNILISPDGDIKLTDFDYSIISECSLLFTDTTRVGSGTLRWMAPELVEQTGYQRSRMTDVYALGMTLLEVITGDPPYHPQCSNDAQVMFKVVKKVFPERNPMHFPPDQRGNAMWNLLARCWDYDAASRPTAQDVLDSVLSFSCLYG